jgi:hypothetical protein
MILEKSLKKSVAELENQSRHRSREAYLVVVIPAGLEARMLLFLTVGQLQITLDRFQD